MTALGDPAPLLASQPTEIPEHSEADQRAYFDAAMERCVAAEARTGTIRRQFDLAGTRVELVFAGDRFVAALTAALAHLAEPVDRTADVTIHVWDSVTSGIDMIPPPVTRDAFTSRGEMWGMGSPRVRSAFHWGEYSVNLLDLDRRIGMCWIGVDGALPYWTVAAPLRTLFHWWMEENGGQLLHAAAVGTPDGAVLITGKGGVGKSTTALACLSGGMQYIGDDYLVVKLDPEPRAYSLFTTAKLDPKQVERFPNLRPMVSHPATGTEDKTVIQLVPGYANQVRRSLPLKAVATPSFGSAPKTVVSAASRVALQRAAEFTTLSQLPHAGRATHAFIERLIATLPGLHFALGHDVTTLPDTIGELIAMNAEDLRRLATPPDSGAVAAARPLVSVILPVYNGVDFLPWAIANVLEQAYPALDIVVVDDGSLEDVGAAVRALPIDVRYIPQPNGGPAAARNRGIRDAAGDLLAFLDVDDLWVPGMLHRYVDVLLANPEIDVVHGRSQLTRFTSFDDPGEFIGGPAETFPYSIAAGVYRRRAFERVGLFDKAMRFGEDSDWFLRAVELGLPIEQLEEVTLLVRKHDNNMTRGATAAEVNPLRLFKNALDRKRARR